MGASLRRRMYRQYTGVTKRACAIRWTTGESRRDSPSSMKADDGAERSFSVQRKCRRGNRSRVAARAGKARPPLSGSVPDRQKPSSSRRYNHQYGRTYLWAVKAANRLAGLKSAQRLMENLPSFDSSGGRVPKSWLAKRGHQPPLEPWLGQWWIEYEARWHAYARRARFFGIPPTAAVEETPMKFLHVRAPPQREDVDSFLALLATRLPAPTIVPPSAPAAMRDPVVFGGRMCRHCGGGPFVDHPSGGRCRLPLRSGLENPRRLVLPAEVRFRGLRRPFARASRGARGRGPFSN
jgi:hypothetical protein